MKHFVVLLCLLFAVYAASTFAPEVAMQRVAPTPTPLASGLLVTLPPLTATPVVQATPPPEPTVGSETEKSEVRAYGLQAPEFYSVPIVPTPTRESAPPTPTVIPSPALYTVQPGDTAASVATRFNLTVDELVAINHLGNPNSLQVGQSLQLVPPEGLPEAPGTPLLPDSEVVYSPAYTHFDTAAVIQRWGGFLAHHREEVEGESLTGAEIVDRVAKRYSVGPRVLLALLELQSGWVTQSEPVERAYPMRQHRVEPNLFKQLSWVANRLNEGYYDNLLGTQDFLHFPDGARIRANNALNPGSSAVQGALAALYPLPEWQQVISDSGFPAVYQHLFRDPWLREVAPLAPPDLTQPPFPLPWAPGEVWYFTGGPHGGWDEGSARAGLDFAPPTKGGCAVAPEWVLAVADGVIARSENGEVVLDLDGDGFIGTGWTVLYMHMATHERIPLGTRVKAGDRIGHPSCEGGWSQAAHLHIARRYNGQWMQADRAPAFVMGGWQPVAWERTYQGELLRADERRQASMYRVEELNAILGD